METFEKGTRVRVNANYGEPYKDPDGTIAATVGELGTVTATDCGFIEVRMDNESLRLPWGEHLFAPEEVDVLEEAHPL